jgi:hypothetical protein
VSSLLAQLDGRYDAALENLRGLTNIPGWDFEVDRAYLHTYKRDYEAALQAWQIATPALFDEKTRDTVVALFPTDACVVADVARRVGEAEWAEALAQQVRDYVREDLPRYRQHAALELTLCHATLGDYEAALAQLETNLRHRHFDFWWEPRLLEMFDPLRGNPRFENVMQAFEDEMARQRANLDRLEAELQQEAGP